MDDIDVIMDDIDDNKGLRVAQSLAATVRLGGLVALLGGGQPPS